ncbi:hypothetical protein [Bradyrhizobium sp. NP1]|uniref:DUF6968 family protein n=1 Tax=Bradyrhizobium sp. NP1 TaxID=3049772 RepID=UPI0025A523DE|nr:hypothetical protein [Bradyrhizobium sp. NP1]WJR76463.1 hypothetical protein QOU61_27420 [Bradyrhizobium sp. NP1]
MEWNEPYLMRYAFRFGVQQRPAEARLEFPRPDEVHANEWVCSFQVHGLKDDRIRHACGRHGLQALVIASDVIRKLLDRTKNISFDGPAYELVFPRYIPICGGLEFHRELCKLIDTKIEMEQVKLSKRWRSRER